MANNLIEGAKRTGLAVAVAAVGFGAFKAGELNGLVNRVVVSGTESAPVKDGGVVGVSEADVDKRVNELLDQRLSKAIEDYAKKQGYRTAVKGLEGAVRDFGGIEVIGVPDSVAKNTVDYAKGVFENKTGVAPFIFAEPGGLHVGPDFGSGSALNPWGRNPAGWDAMYNSGGSIQPFSPVTQEVIRWSGEAYQNLPEGGFMWMSTGQARVRIGDTEIFMPHMPGHNYFFAARGIYPDGKQDSDLNGTAVITDYKPGHTLVEMYESRLETNLAFISEEGGLVQRAATSHVTNTNCGAEGCSDLTVVTFDANTKALGVWKHTQVRSTNMPQVLSLAEKNWIEVATNIE